MLEADSRFSRQIAEVFEGLVINGRQVTVKMVEGSARPPRSAGAFVPRKQGKPGKFATPNAYKKIKKKSFER